MVKRYTLNQIFTALNTGEDLDMPDCNVVAETDYDRLEAALQGLLDAVEGATPEKPMRPAYLAAKACLTESDAGVKS